jgi:hypothetical protein
MVVARRAYGTTGYDSTYKNLMINKNTKVLCQGFTGKTVMSSSIIEQRLFHSHTPADISNFKMFFIETRVLSTHNKPLNTAQTWLVVSPPRRLVRLTSAFLFSPMSERYCSQRVGFTSCSA